MFADRAPVYVEWTRPLVADPVSADGATIHLLGAVGHDDPPAVAPAEVVAVAPTREAGGDSP